MGDTLIKYSTNRILQANPSLTYAEIGRLLGVSRERIRQVADGRRRYPRICKVCRHRIRLRHDGVTQAAYSLRYCADCWAAAKEKRRQARYVAFTCEVCSTTFSRTAGTVKRMEKRGQKIRWCGRQCHGKWLGANHGHNRAD